MKYSFFFALKTLFSPYAIVPAPGNRQTRKTFMKPTVLLPILIFVTVFSLVPTASFAATFDTNLSLNGSQSGADVQALQQFLKDQGLFAADVTGKFLTQTYAAVVSFQKKNGISPASGFWGPGTRAAANTLASASVGAGTVATATVTAVTASDSDIPADVYQQIQSQLAAIWVQMNNLKNLFAKYHKPSTGATSTVTTGSTVPSPSSSSSASTATSVSASTVSGSSSSSSANTSTNSTATVSSGIPWGAYTGDTVSALSSLEGTVGKQATFQAIFWGWDDTFPTTFSSLGSAKTLVIFWEPSFNYDAINDGSKDAYIASFAKGAKAYAGTHKVILVPFSEMNLGEEVWGDTGSNTPAKFVSAWKRVHDIFVANAATNVSFGLAYNNESTGSHKSFADYYPGSSYVDYVGIDGFNFGSPWTMPKDIFSGAVATVSGYGKPLMIFSTGSASGSQKAAWITAFGSYVKTVPNLKGWIWFNDNKEQNWLVNSDSTALATFKGII